MVACESGDDGIHVVDAEREVVHHAELVEIGLSRVVEHVFQPVGAVRDLQADVVGSGIALLAAMPVRTEAEQVAVEGVLRFRVAHDEAGVDDAVRRERCEMVSPPGCLLPS